jgi:hypothetical protein
LWPPFYAFTKEFLKNTKENIPTNHFCSHLRKDGQIDLPSSPDCHICIAVSKKKHNGHLKCHNGHTALWLFDAIMASNVGNMGVFGKKIYIKFFQIGVGCGGQTTNPNFCQAQPISSSSSQCREPFVFKETGVR